MPFAFHPGPRDAATRARRGAFTTAHGRVETPAFMPVGTRASVTGLTPADLSELGAEIILGNTYHLLLRPGPEAFRRFGGIHGFMRWSGPVLTDSGGFQIFSLAHDRTITEEGARFRSYVDCRMHVLSPEASIEMQTAIGSDMMMVLDVCLASTAEAPAIRAAMDRTHRWALRSLAARANPEQALFAIVQGGLDPALRAESARFLTQHPFDGFAIGGLAVGDTRAERADVVARSAELLPEDRPRYLMGVGTPPDILEAIGHGRRHVRLRPADHHGLAGHRLHRHRPRAAHPHRAPPGRRAARRRLRLLDLPHLQPRLPPPPAQGEGAARPAAPLHPQPAPLPRPPALGPGRHRGRPLRRLRAREARGHRSARARSERSSPRAPAAAGAARADRAGLLSDRPAILSPRSPSASGSQGDRFHLVLTSLGVPAVRDAACGEVMHPVIGPAVESERLYVAQSRLPARLAEPGPPLVLLDVGLGAGSNALAALRAARAAAPGRRLDLVSLELDPGALALAASAEGAARLGIAGPDLSAARALLGGGVHEEPRARWRLVLGDALETLPAEDLRADLVFWDPFSPRANPSMWTLRAFQAAFARCAARADLYTYSTATATRSALLLAGFFVGAGDPSGPKEQTTAAATAPGLLARPLDGRWLSRLERSSAPFPPDAPPDALERVRAHPQFS